MSIAIDVLLAAIQKGMDNRPAMGGFPYLAETLRQAGVKKNIWFLPACQSLYFTEHGLVIIQGTPLVSGAVDVPPFNREALITALRTDQAGKSIFAEFLNAAWQAGIIRYQVDFSKRTVCYYGANEEEYVEEYPNIEEKQHGGSEAFG